MVDAVRQVEGVMPGKPVDALYDEVGDYAMIHRVWWWIESYADRRQMYRWVHRALQATLDAAEIDLPFPTQSASLQAEPVTVRQLSQAFGED